jgi:hypothetical protein
MGFPQPLLQELSDALRRYAAEVPEVERIQYEAAEIEAREAKRGLWQQQAIPPRAFRWRRGVKLSSATASLKSQPKSEYKVK